MTTIMENKRKRIEGSDTYKAIAKVGRSKTDKLKIDELIAEKDELKQVEEIPIEQKTTHLHKPHMLFR
jgi:hypothetical protein